MVKLNSEALVSVQEMIVSAKAICAARIKEIEVTLDALVAEKDALVKQLQSLESVDLSKDDRSLVLNSTMPDSNETSTNGNDYDKNWPWGHKIQFVLRQSNKAITPKQIVEEIFKLEPELRESKSLNSITSVISSKIKSGTLIRHNIDGPNKHAGSYLVGLPE